MKDTILIKLYRLRGEVEVLAERDTHAPKIKRDALESIDNLIKEIKTK